jgi:hypothetical protein
VTELEGVLGSREEQLLHEAEAATQLQTQVWPVMKHYAYLRCTAVCCCLLQLSLRLQVTKQCTLGNMCFRIILQIT